MSATIESTSTSGSALPTHLSNGTTKGSPETPHSITVSTLAQPAVVASAPLVAEQNLKPPPNHGVLKPDEEQIVQSIRPIAGAKRTLMTHDKDGKLLSEKKLRRLEKNRLSARECRRRKREATENMERQINVLEAENLRLRLQLQIGKEAEQSRLREQEKLTQDINDLLKSGASEADIHATLEEFKEKHADYGKSRRSTIEFHLRNIERLLMPTQTTSLCISALSNSAATEPVASVAAISPLSTDTASAQSSESSIQQLPAMTQDPSKSANLEPKTLFQYLVNYLGVTPQQAAALKDSRFVAQELDGCLEQALSVQGELRQRLAQTGDDLDTQFNNVRNILTPTQAAKFLVWVANNKACIHMLNELWDRLDPGTESRTSSWTADDAEESP